jgi:hypothetical protein
MGFEIGNRVKVVSSLPRLIEKFGKIEGEIIRINTTGYIEVYFSILNPDKSSFIFPESLLELIKTKNYFYGI